jgi:SAM-dependent methyltransferase
MKKILFFIENKWAFGRIHNDLIKTLYPDIHCDIIDWCISYDYADVPHFMDTYDYIITTPHGGFILDTSYKIPPRKIGIVAHSNSDIEHITITQNLSQDYFNEFKAYAVISPIIKEFSISHGIQRIPHVLSVGCFNSIYKKNTSKTIKKIGYIGGFHRHRSDIKRGELVAEVAKKLNLQLVHHHNRHFLCCASMHCDYDILMFSSTTEGLPTGLLEAFSCGIPVIGTHTGVFPELAKSGGGIILPFDENAYIEQSVSAIKYLIENPDKYQEMSVCALEQSKKHDWSIARNKWIEFINSMYENPPTEDKENYCIMSDYIIRENPYHFDDRVCTDQAQDEVYEFAKKLLNEKQLNDVVDIGCGSGFKLIKYFSENNTVGIETEPCLSQLKEQYPSRNWINSGVPEESFSSFTKTTDMIICSDVIEHIKNPDELLNYINSFDYKYAIISTPDRRFLRKDLAHIFGERYWWGPPLNGCHVREWTFEEFEEYLKRHFSKVEGTHCSKQIECMFFVCEK